MQKRGLAVLGCLPIALERFSVLGDCKSILRVKHKQREEFLVFSFSGRGGMLTINLCGDLAVYKKMNVLHVAFCLLLC